MKLSVIIPCYNEEKTIGKIISLVQSASALGMTKEIIVVDDASTDNSAEVLKSLGKEIILISLKTNQGKGNALRIGFGRSTGDVVLVQDADLEYDPDEYELLLEPITTGRADVVYGSRFMGGRPHRVVYFWHSVMNWMLTTFSNMMTNINLTDMETCYKVFRGDLIRKIAKNLESKRFGFEPEITARLSKIKDIRFYEVGISYYGRTYGEGKHINWKDGVKAMFEIIKFNVFRK